MKRAAALAALLLAACAACAHAGSPCTSRGSALALPVLAGEAEPELLLAQRAIEREWGPSDDTLYREVEIPEWKSEGLAMALSAALPGAGQAYVGEGSALWYFVAEAAGWTANLLFKRRAEDLRDDYRSYAGTPGDSASAWSFERWAEATGGDPGELERLYAADREAFYRLIATDAQYLAGWSGDADATRRSFVDLRERSQDEFGNARLVGMALWINHVVSAADALRAARFHNLPLRHDLQIKLRTSWRRRAPAVVAVLERRF